MQEAAHAIFDGPVERPNPELLTAAEAHGRRTRFVVRRGGMAEERFREILRSIPVMVLDGFYEQAVLEECPICGAALEREEGGAENVWCRWGCVCDEA